MSCADLRAAYHQDGFVVAQNLVPKDALEAAFGPEGLPAGLTVGRYGYEEMVSSSSSSPPTLTTLEKLPKGVAHMHHLNLIHNGHFLHAVRGLWPVIMSASFGAACVFGMLPESFVMEEVGGPIASVIRSSSEPLEPLIRLNAHLKLAPKVPGVSHQHAIGHRDYAFWRKRLDGLPQHHRDEFLNNTLTAWIPLVPVGPYGSMTYGKEIATPTGASDARSSTKLHRVSVPAHPGDVLLHDLKTFHWSTLMRNTSEDVRWHLELRFHNAAVLDRSDADLKHDELHQVMTGPAIENVNTEKSYSTLLDVIYQGIEKVRWRFNYETLREIWWGSEWQRPLKIPLVGLGTGRLWPAEEIANSMYSFLVMGGRHLDTAASYWSHAMVAPVCRAAREHGVLGKDLVITTKIWPLGFKESLEAARKALRDLDGVGKVVLLLHTPGQINGKPKGPGPKKFDQAPASCRDEARPNSWRRCRVESFLALAALREAGVVSGIGVSNFLKRHLEELRRDLRETTHHGQRGLLRKWPPDVLQNEVHLLYRQQVVSFGTLGSPEAKATLLSNSVVQQAAAMESLTAAQVLMKWALQRGLHLIPTTSNLKHMEQLLQVPSLPNLRPSTMALLESLEEWKDPIYNPLLQHIE